MTELSIINCHINLYKNCSKQHRAPSIFLSIRVWISGSEKKDMLTIRQIP